MALTLLVGASFIAFLVVALRRARQRRRAEFAGGELQDDARLGADRVDGLPAIPEPSSPDEHEAAEPEELAGDEEEEAPAAAPPEAVASPVQAAAPADAALQRGLEKTNKSFLGRLNQLFARGAKIDDDVLEELEDLLLMADVGVKLSSRLIEELRVEVKQGRLESAAAVRAALRQRMGEALAAGQKGDDPLATAAPGRRPRVILFVGVNGVGKTTTIGKVAQQLRGRGASVVMAAGDTFRAAAAEQLSVWGERTDSRVIRGDEGSDPASVVYNAIRHAADADVDVVLADTAGRLHTKTELMDEIRKVKRAAGKAIDGAPDETWLVVDATTGQNALQQAREFNEVLGLTGLILTKLDGTAKGGVVVNIVDDLKLPVRFVGVGEKAEDLRPFNASGFIAALFQA